MARLESSPVFLNDFGRNVLQPQAVDHDLGWPSDKKGSPVFLNDFGRNVLQPQAVDHDLGWPAKPEASKQS